MTEGMDSAGLPASSAPPTRPASTGEHGHSHGHGQGHGAPTHGRPGTSVADAIPASLVPEQGWHFLHLFFTVDRDILGRLSSGDRERGKAELIEALGRKGEGGADQSHCFLVPGHKADFGIVLAGPDIKAIRRIQTDIQASGLGPALKASYSFYSITEVSEYVPNPEQYGEILRREGVDPASATYTTKINAYTQRLGPMNKQRMYPEFPDWPCLCFYPMSKLRVGEQNWYTLPFEKRAELMSQHGRSGMKFAGKVTQVITASTGLDEWEWGVTLWAKNPSYLKDIVYTMRFDESSAVYAAFGDFLVGYIMPPAELVDALRV